jgi:Membrane carboxypeptidase/penicillin-binding protein
VTGVYVGYDQVQSLGRLEQGGRTAAPIFRYYRSEVEDRYPKDDFVMPEGIVMADGLAFKADQPMQGASATSPTTADGTAVDTSEGGEDLMRQMF